MNNSQIHATAEFSIPKGKIEEYKKLVQEMSKLVRDNEPDTIGYKFYLSRDETQCIVHETYRNSKAVLAHNNGIASQTILPKIFNISKMNRLDVYGTPDEELQKVLASFSAQIYDLFTGFSR
jgi:quinol monooxygenase YgiN